MEKFQSVRRLNEVDILRPLAIFLVVVLHCFTVYWGKWSPFEGYAPCAPYKWIAATSFSFTMELFVLLSGYIFGYQLLVLKKDFTLKSLAKNKLKRLIVPSLVFGVLYALIFYWNKDFFTVAYRVLSGAGHLWFLQMLFWCFILAFLLYKSGMSDKYKFLILIGAIAISTVNIPLRLDKAFYYLFFFYLGIILSGRQESCRKLCRNNLLLTVLLVIYLTLFIAYEMCLPMLKVSKDSFWLYSVVPLLKRYWIFAYALPGTLFFFLLAYRIMQDRSSVPSWIMFCSSISFGVYLFHQIIIEVIYYKTSLPVLVGPYLIPWVCLLITLPLSVVLVLLVRKANLKFLSI